MRGWGVLSNCFVRNLYFCFFFIFSLFLIFQLETGVVAGGLLLNCFVVNLYFFCFSSSLLIFFSWRQAWGWGAPVELFCSQFIFLLIFPYFFIFQLETGVGAGGLLLNRQFPPPLTIEHGPDITKEKKNHPKSVEHVF